MDQLQAELERLRAREAEAPERATLEASERRAAVGEERTAVAPTETGLVALWRARFEAAGDDPRANLAVVRALIDELDGDEARLVVSALWGELLPLTRRYLIDRFARAGHPAVLAVLHLGATDADLELQKRALGALQRYAFRDFAEDYPAYLRWAETWDRVAVEDVLEANAKAFVARLRGLTPQELTSLLWRFQLDLDAGEAVGIDLRASSSGRDCWTSRCTGWIPTTRTCGAKRHAGSRSRTRARRGCARTSCHGCVQATSIWFPISWERWRTSDTRRRRTISSRISRASSWSAHRTAICEGTPRLLPEPWSPTGI